MGISAMIDRAIATVAPEKGLKRAAARQKMQILNSGYGNYGANVYKKSMKGWLFAGGSHREDIEDNASILRQRSRDLYMGVPIANGAIKTMRTNVVGRGLRLKPTIDREAIGGMTAAAAQKLEKQIEREWRLWAESPDCDIERIDNFYELQQLAFLNWLMSGDCLAVLPIKPRKNQPYDLRVQLIEADRLSSPDYCDSYDNKIVGGVEVAPDGEVVAYHISNQHPLSYEVTDIKWQRVEAYTKAGRRNVLHIMTRERIGQRRGVPFLAPVIESLRQLGKYTDAELIAAVVSGMFTVFVEKEDASGDEAIGSMIPEEQQIDEEDETSLEMGPGVIMDLNPGEHIHDTNPGRPNSNFSMFVEAICQQIGAALEIPYELLVKRFNSSYTASKGALEEAWKMFRMYRAWLATDFCQPIYEEWLTEAVAKGRIEAPGFFSDPLIRKAYCRAEWNGPAKGILDPVKEVSAAEKRVQNGFSTRSSETMEMTGGDYFSNTDQVKQEEKKLSEVKKVGKGNEQQKQQPGGAAGNEPAAGQQDGAGNEPAGDEPAGRQGKPEPAGDGKE